MQNFFFLWESRPWKDSAVTHGPIGYAKFKHLRNAQLYYNSRWAALALICMVYLVSAFFLSAK